MCCTVVLYYYLHDIFFLEQGVEPEGFLRGEVEKILYYLLLTLMLLLYSSVNFFITQTQDGLWNIVHSTFMFFHIPYDDVKEGTTYIHRPGQIQEKEKKFLLRFFYEQKQATRFFQLLSIILVRTKQHTSYHIGSV